MKKITTFFIILLFSFVFLFLCSEFNVIDLTGAAYNNNIFFNRIVNNGLSIEDKDLSKSMGKEDKFYYNQLSTEAKAIYDSMLNNKENLKSGTYSVAIDSSLLSNISSNSDMVNYEFQNAINALKYDNVDLFYIDFSKIVLNTRAYISDVSTSYEYAITYSNKYTNYYYNYIYSEKELNEIYKKIESIKKDILKDARGSNYNKIKLVHDWLVDNLSYDNTYKKNGNRNIYGALINNNVVCEGYAKAFKYLLDELDIPCILVTGTSVDQSGNEEDHMWNYVKINDKWYAVDVTFDDPVLIGVSNVNLYKYKYFCQGDNINTDHFLENKVTKNGQNITYPDLYHKEMQ